MSDPKTSLKPMTPHLSKRYKNSAWCVSASRRTVSSPLPSLSSVETQHQTIPAALFTSVVDPECVLLRPAIDSLTNFRNRPAYLPPGWGPYVHPEGALYFYRDSQLNVVTGDNLSSEVALQHVLYWSEEIMRMFGDIGVPFSDSYELCLEFDEDDLSCGYYIADHSKRCIFWLEPMSTEDVGMTPAFSLEHLRKQFSRITIPPKSPLT